MSQGEVKDPKNDKRVGNKTGKMGRKPGSRNNSSQNGSRE
jgi:hypothetical protein